jgi:hypothetical protein
MPTPSLREQFLQRALTVLQGAGTGAVSITRSREVSITRAQTPAIVLMPQSTELTRLATGADKQLFEFTVEYFVRGDTWDSKIDAVDVAGHAALMGDQQLASIVGDLRRIGEAFEAQEADRTAGTLTVRYRTVFLTRAGDISSAAI